MVRKTCPWRHMAFYSEGRTKKAAKQEEFAPCVEGKCAMWREAIRTIQSEGRNKPIVVGFCGLAGRPW